MHVIQHAHLCLCMQKCVYVCQYMYVAVVKSVCYRISISTKTAECRVQSAALAANISGISNA
jgi:hypothetical protein